MAKIKKGEVYFYFCYDISEEIDLDKIDRLLGKKTEKYSIYTKSLSPSYMQYSIPPLFAELGSVTTTYCGKTVKGHILVKIYDFGAVTLRFGVDFDGDLNDLLKFSCSTERANLFSSEAEDIIRKIKIEIRDTLTNPEKKKNQSETYTIFTIRRFDKDFSGQSLYRKYWKIIAKIVKQEHDSMSESELKTTIENSLSYYKNDLIIVDWNSAFVYDTSKDFEVLDVIEFALIQSLELRVYDNYLDVIIQKAYGDLGKEKTRFMLRYRNKLNNLLYIKLEITEVVDRVENSLKLVGEPFLAKIYSLASKKFYIDTWKSSVRSKLNALENIYESLSTQVQNDIMLVLEVSIVLLFIIDLIALFYF